MNKIEEKGELDVLDYQEEEEEEAFVEYDIATYPSDLTLSVVNEMWMANDIEIPKFQRHFVWTIKQSSLLIESFLMGLPVPQVFVYVDENSRSLVIDGQQRILSIIFFFEGYFGSESLQGKRQVFRLTGVNEKSPYYNKRFIDLDDSEQRKLKSAVLRFMNIRQLNPKKENTSIYHIFERLNTGGTPLKPQEIRNCVFRGELVDTLDQLNKLSSWRKILGRKDYDKHQKDKELVLRLLALFKDWKNYEKPMKEYLNKSMGEEKKADSSKVKNFVSLFQDVCKLVVQKIGPKPFHVRGPFNSSVFDSVMCTLMENYNSVPDNLKQRFEILINDNDYEPTTYYGTSDEKILKERFRIAKRILID